MDDEPMVRGLLRTLLMHAGYEVETAENGAAALDLLERGATPHLIVLDMAMPELDGRGFREIQFRKPDLARIPVVVCSGEAPRPHDDLFAGCPWIEKPLSAGVFLATVREALLSQRV